MSEIPTPKIPTNHNFQYLSNEVDEALAALGHALLRPLDELELADGARFPATRVRHLELPQDVLGEKKSF